MMPNDSLFQHDAQLMWTPKTADSTPNVYVYFRSRLQLDSIDGSAILRIYAKDIYELYVNEQFIGMGPCQSAPPYVYYDKWDVTGKIGIGNNLVTVKIHYGGHISPEAFQFAGFIAELEFRKKCGHCLFFLQNSNDWRCRLSPSYRQNSDMNIGRVGYSEDYTMTPVDEQWFRTIAPEDGFTVPVFTRTITAAHWCRRPIPLLRSKLAWPVKVTAAEDGSTMVDFGQFVFGRVTVAGSVAAPADVIDVEYIEALDAGWAVTEGRRAMYTDRLRSLPLHFRWTSFNKRAFRYLRLSGGIYLSDGISVDQYNYPIKTIGAFSCSDPLLNRIWELCDRTLRVNIDDLYNDCPHRDKAQWMDAFVTAKAALSMYGIKTLTRKCLLQHGICSYRDGKLTSPSIAGGSWLPDYALIHIVYMLWYFKVTGDISCLEELYEGAAGIIADAQKYRAADGLLQNMNDHEGFVYLDNTFELYKNGKSAALNALYFTALNALAEIAEQLHRVEDALQYRRMAAELKDVFVAVLRHSEIPECFNDTDRVFKHDFYHLNFSCELGKWQGSGIRVKTFLYSDCEKEFEMEFAAYAGCNIVLNGKRHEFPRKPSWSRQPMYEPLLLDARLDQGWNEVVFEVEFTSLNWELFFRNRNGAALLFSATQNTDVHDTLNLIEIDWSNGMSGNPALPLTATARKWWPPHLSQTTHGYIGFSGLLTPEQNAAMLQKTLSEVYYRDYQSIRVPFFSTITADEQNLKDWILPCNTPWSAFFYLSSLFDYGLGREALQWIRMAWGKMVEQDAVNCWEEWDSHSSLCHAWGASAACFMHREILGVKLEGLAENVITIRPALYDLQWASGTVAFDEDSEESVVVKLQMVDGNTDIYLAAPPSRRINLDTSRLRNPVLNSESNCILHSS